MDSTAFCIVGMHRSGTSLTAGWLKRSGLNVGDNLIDNGFDNPLGHFEDLEIVNFHRKELESIGLDNSGLYVNKLKSAPVEFVNQKLAYELFEKRGQCDFWGFKDPRTTLFLFAWKKLVPNFKTIIVYRHYSEVVDSLCRRLIKQLASPSTPTFTKFHWEILKTLRLKMQRKHYLNAWIRYNQIIINYHKANPTESLIVSNRELVEHNELIIDKINEMLGAKFITKNISEFYDSNLMTVKEINKDSHNHFDKRAEDVLSELKSFSMVI